MPDVYAIGGNKVDILAGGFRTDQFRPEAIQLAEREPERLVREEGIPGRGEVRVRWFVRGKGSEVTVSFHGQKAKVVSSILKIQ
jgi:hypothetical protein